MKPRFSNVLPAEIVDIIRIKEEYEADKNEDKIDLIAGAYRTAEGKPLLLPLVRRIEQQITSDPDLNHEYTWFLGMDRFNKLAPALILGENSPALLEGRAFGAQTLSGNGALRLGAEFLSRHLQYNIVYMSTPTWDNHDLVFRHGGFTDLRYYRYWDAATRGVDFAGLLTDLQQAPENSVVILQVTAHNPTGCDLTRKQWVQIADVMQERNLFPFFDAAYQGFATADLDRDAWPVRYFVDRGFELFVAQSFSKNLALYSERVGCLTVVLARGRARDANSMISQMKLIDRATYNTPPKHGALVVITILSNPTFMEEWKDSLKVIVERIVSMRRGLKERLEQLGTPGKWDHITSQIGMFSYSGLTPEQVEHMRKKHHVYVLSSGRVNIAGLTFKNLDRVARAIHDAVVTLPNDVTHT